MRGLQCECIGIVRAAGVWGICGRWFGECGFRVVVCKSLSARKSATGCISRCSSWALWCVLSLCLGFACVCMAFACKAYCTARVFCFQLHLNCNGCQAVRCLWFTLSSSLALLLLLWSLVFNWPAARNLLSFSPGVSSTKFSGFSMGVDPILVLQQKDWSSFRLVQLLSVQRSCLATYLCLLLCKHIQCIDCVGSKLIPLMPLVLPVAAPAEDVLVCVCISTDVICTGCCQHCRTEWMP